MTAPYVTPEGWTVYEDEAYLPGEKLPVHKRPYRRLTDEERATYNRDWMRRYRALKRPAASLHDLRCTGPTFKTGCRCQKIRLYRREP